MADRNIKKPQYVKDYRDPLHGFISVYPHEQKIIDSREFQRLRSIAQLGTTFLTYPSACHSRFEHSLGVLYVSTLLFDKLVERHKNLEILHWDSTDIITNRLLLRLAALLHDIGHPPFSHSAEIIFPENPNTKEPYCHEDYTYRIVLREPIKDIINSFLGDESANKVARIAAERPQDLTESFLMQIIAGDLGSDRMDYLLRDSYHLGVKYGVFDLHRLLNTINIIHSPSEEGPDLAIEEGGVHTIEGFVLARYFMFLEVYYHKTRRITDAHLIEFLKTILPDQKFPEDLDSYLLWDDHLVRKCLNDNYGKECADRLLCRKHFRECYYSTAHPERYEEIIFDWLEEELKTKFNPNALCFDAASKSPYVFDKPPLFILVNSDMRPLEERSSVVKQLKSINKRRIYSEPSIRNEVKDFCIKFMQEKYRKYVRKKSKT